ncbi:probable ubiquitin-like-specific protease 2B isoform X2 [Lactuca sativa]|uniref:probable ubiquitin-like-specific protease 2B isoform X2 n=1 Tax=Lactuca sativa TaxID=4236 RepID=UPI001C69090A|nr:probable ubiquitin-like-specific protease 2B isoform X2 [Lactuca sativa]
MKTVCNKNLDVFDFKDESPRVALRITSKLDKIRNAAIDKYTFLATGENISEEELKYVPSLGIDAINITHMATTLIEDPSAVMVTDSNDAFTVAEQPPPQSTPELEIDLSESEVNVATTSASPSNNKLNSVILDPLPNLPEFICSDGPSSRSESHLKSSQKQDEAIEMDPDENGSLCEGSSSSSDVSEDDGVVVGTSSNHCIARWEMNSEDIGAVVFYPDYMVYRDSYYTDSVISFNSNSIKMKASTTDGDDKTFKFKWGIEDILQIRSYWHEQVEMTMVVIYVHTKELTENVDCNSDTKLKFAVIGSQCQWYEKLEAIASLNVIYKDLWTNMLDSEDVVLGHTREPNSKYLPNFSRPFEEVVYPKGDADAVSISKRDFDLLQPDTFVNDTIIDFYIKYLKNKIKPEERHRFHFFNSFFFRKLADPDNDPFDASKGIAAFQRVKKWTRKVNLFEKDYVFIPVNYNYHWSLLVICNLGEVATYKDEDVNKSMRVPCVLHMDSIRGSHTGLKGLLQSYLKEEWKERKQEASEDICSRFDNLRFISLELPQQQNSFDCGLFLLHYVELFLEEAPLHFNPFKITNSFNFLNMDWFPPADASLKRVVIQKLICDLLENPHQEQQCHLTCSTTTNFPKDDPSTSFELESFMGKQLSTNNFDELNLKGSLTPIEQEEVEGGRHGCSETESAIQQGNGMTVDNDSDSQSSLETSTSGCQDEDSDSDSDSVEIVNGVDVEEVGIGLKKKRDEITDCTQIDDDDDDTCIDMMVVPCDRIPTKKLRITQESKRV